MSRIHILAVGSILAGQLFIALGGVAAHEGSAGQRSAPRESGSLSGQSWFDPALPGIPSHASASARRNPPYLDPLRSPEVRPVSNSPLLSSLLGKWQEIDPPYAAPFRTTGPDAVTTGILECSVIQGGTAVETRWQRTWESNVLPGTDVRNFLFATNDGFYLHRVLDHGKSLQLAGGRADSVGARVAHCWQYTNVGEEWRLVSPDTLKLQVWQARGGGPPMIGSSQGYLTCGTVLIEDHVFTRMRD